MFDVTGTYEAPFCVGGTMMIVGGLLCCLLHLPSCRVSLAARQAVPERASSSTPESGFEDIDSDVEATRKHENGRTTYDKCDITVD